MDEREPGGAGRPLNTITVAGRELLLVEVGGGEVHVASEYVDGDIGIEVGGAPDDDENAILWANKTLCGREWRNEAPGPDDPTLWWQDAAYAPTCRACLRVVDSWLPKSTAPLGVALLAEVVAEAVVARSSTYVTGVPGEHLEATRRAIRKALRDRGCNSGTHALDDVLVVWSDDAFNALDRDELGASAAAAIERIMAGGSKAEPLQTATAWRTWVADF
ncbi:hypothetical protein HC251_04185 [Iamia sp. SCSIO 61187]|uniref:hypothetical protein n=1 Tax=Iamia sp. SCSIO 61187 TaxID=2722752 RepID=UPI001C6311ED|nr:hypothetical protein [Iamia sp. SCSIO 61187]QYG91714.1 hypothetical protein HC251_04185 [Iamia sp. SCSIO 61187]